MSRILLLFTLLLAVCTTCGYAQTAPNLNTAFDYAILSKEQIINFQNTSVYGIAGSANRTSITDNGNFMVSDNMFQLGTLTAKQALADAQETFDLLYNLPGQTLTFPTLGGRSLEAGVSRINGNATLNGGLTLNAKGDPDAVFVIIVTGNLTSDVDKAWVNLINGAQPKNVFWVVNGQVNTGKTSLFQGTVIANGSGGITFGSGGIVIGRAIALNGNITLNDNLVFMPNMVIANLSVIKVADEDDYTLGGTVTYTITATNLGPDDATGVRVIEEIPSGLEFVSATPERGDYDPVKHIWTIGNLAVNTEVSLRITFKIVSTGTIRNKVVIIGDNPDQSPDQDEDEEDIIVSEIGVAKSIVDRREEYYVGDMVRYKITVRNNTSATETNVRIGEKLPEGLAYVGQTITGPQGLAATYTPETGIFHIQSLPGNAVVELLIDAQLIKNGRVANIVRIINKDVKPDVPSKPEDEYKDSDPDNDEDEEVIPEVQCRPLTVSLTSSASVHCASVTGLMFTATEVIGATYTWALPTGWVIASGNGTNSIVVTPGALGGEQQVTVTVKNQCDVVVESAPVSINITGTPATPVINGDGAVCYNATEGTLLSTQEVDGYTYTWEVVSGAIKITGEGASVRVLPSSATNLEGGVVQLTVTNNCGLSNTATKAISVTPAPAKPAAITGDINLCQSRTATFEASEVAGATSYTWTFPPDWKVEGADNGRTITVTVGAESGAVTVRALNQCSAGDAATKEITVVEQPTVENFTLNSETASLCEGQELTLTATEVPDAKGYAFAVTGGLQLVRSSGNKVTVKAGATGGTVSVTVTDFCDRTLTVSKDIAVTAALAPVTISGETAVCRNSRGNVYSATAYDVPVTYTWTATGDLTITEGEGTSQIAVSAGMAGGSLMVIVSNENGCFTVTKTFPVNTLTPPALPTLITGSTDVCEGSTVTYSVPNVAGLTYTWTAPNGWSIAANNSASASITVGAASGSVLLTATDACGNATEISLDVTVTQLPVAPTIAGPATVCAGEEVTYTLNETAEGLTYTWNVTGWTIKGTATGNSVTVVAGGGAGNISVTASNKCDAVTASLPVGNTPIPASPGAIAHEVNVCQNSTGNVISVAEVPGATAYTWTLPEGWEIIAGHNTNRITVSVTETGGLVSVTASNCTGTSAPATTTINITLPPAPVTRITDNSNVCDGLMYTADLVQGATSYTWSVPQGFTIESGQGTPTIKVKQTSAGAVGRVAVTAFAGACAGAADYSIEINAQLADGQLDFPKAFSPNGDGKNDTWLVKNLDKFPENEMVIFNRWGAEVFKQRNYKNDWTAQGLGQGTYFYKVQVKLCDGKYQEYSGYVTIFR